MTDSEKRGTLMTYKQIAEDANLGMNTTMRLARESGALIKIGRCARVNPDIFYRYIEDVYTVAKK